MKKITLIISVLMLLFASCSSDKKTKADPAQQAKIKVEVEKKEEALGKSITSKKVNIEEIRNLLKMYDKLYMNNPQDTAMASYLMKGGELALHYKLYKRALNYFDAVENSFENTSHYPMAVFMKAFVYEEAKDTALARAYYEKFIRENPDHELVFDAETSIENLGKSLEEIVQEFENNQTPTEKKAKEEKKKKKIDGGF